MDKTNIVIHKYGGTSISNSDRVKKAAKRIRNIVESGKKVVVVVSAQGDTTDRLIGLAMELNNTPPPREMDMLLSTGEQVSIALMAMSLNALSVKTVSLTGWQAGINTDIKFGSASVNDVNIENIEKLLETYDCIVVAGFQGLGNGNEITTLGRGGSDTTALILAATLGVEMCEVFTDVDGVFSADPRYVKDARKLQDLSFDEMLELASEGARVMDGRAVSFAKRYGIAIHVRSFNSDESGTIVRGESVLEKHAVRGVSYKNDISKVTLVGIPKTPEALYKIFDVIGENGICVDAILQTDSTKDRTDVTFTLMRSDLLNVVKVLQEVARELDVSDVQYEVDCAKVSIVGEGMKNRPGIAAKLFKALAEREINIHMTSTSDTNISVIINLDHVFEAVNAIHEKFNLAKEEV